MDCSSPLNLFEFVPVKVPILAHYAASWLAEGWTLCVGADDAAATRAGTGYPHVLWAASKDPLAANHVIRRFAVVKERGERDGRIRPVVRESRFEFPALGRKPPHNIVALRDEKRSGVFVVCDTNLNTDVTKNYTQQEIFCVSYDPETDTLHQAWRAYPTAESTSRRLVALRNGGALALSWAAPIGLRGMKPGEITVREIDRFGHIYAARAVCAQAAAEPHISLCAIIPSPFVPRKKGAKEADDNDDCEFGAIAVCQAKPFMPGVVREFPVPPTRRQRLYNAAYAGYYEQDPNDPTRFEPRDQTKKAAPINNVVYRLASGEPWPRRALQVVRCGGVEAHEYHRRREPGDDPAPEVEVERVASCDEIYALQDADETIIVRRHAYTDRPVHFTRLARWSMNDDSSRCRSALRPMADTIQFLPPTTLLVGWSQLLAPPSRGKADDAAPPRSHHLVALDLHPVLRWSPVSHASVTSRDFRTAVRGLLSLCLAGGVSGLADRPENTSFVLANAEATVMRGVGESAAAALIAGVAETDTTFSTSDECILTTTDNGASPAQISREAVVYPNDWPLLPAEVVELIIECAWVEWPLR